MSGARGSERPEPEMGRNPRSSPVIEFVGPPGIGKSTVAAELADVLRERGWQVDEPTRRLGETRPAPWRWALRLALAAGSFVRRGRAALAVYGALRAARARPALAWTRLAYWLQHAELFDRAARTPGVAVLDEGLVHWLACTNCRLDRGRALSVDLVEKHLPAPTALVLYVLLDAEPEVHAKRAISSRSGSLLGRRLRAAASPAAAEDALWAARESYAGLCGWVRDRARERPDVVRVCALRGRDEVGARASAEAVVDEMDSLFGGAGEPMPRDVGDG